MRKKIAQGFTASFQPPALQDAQAAVERARAGMARVRNWFPGAGQPAGAQAQENLSGTTTGMTQVPAPPPTGPTGGWQGGPPSPEVTPAAAPAPTEPAKIPRFFENWPEGNDQWPDGNAQQPAAPAPQAEAPQHVLRGSGTSPSPLEAARKDPNSRFYQKPGFETGTGVGAQWQLDAKNPDKALTRDTLLTQVQGAIDKGEDPAKFMADFRAHGAALMKRSKDPMDQKFLATMDKGLAVTGKTGMDPLKGMRVNLGRAGTAEDKLYPGARQKRLEKFRTGRGLPAKPDPGRLPGEAPKGSKWKGKYTTSKTTFQQVDPKTNKPFGPHRDTDTRKPVASADVYDKKPRVPSPRSKPKVPSYQQSAAAAGAAAKRRSALPISQRGPKKLHFSGYTKGNVNPYGGAGRGGLAKPGRMTQIGQHRAGGQRRNTMRGMPKPMKTRVPKPPRMGRP